MLCRLCPPVGRFALRPVPQDGPALLFSRLRPDGNSASVPTPAESEESRRGRLQVSTAGSIKQQPNGTWSFVVDVPAPNGGRQQLRHRGFKTKREAQAELTARSEEHTSELQSLRH